MENISLRDFFAAQLMSGKVFDFKSSSYRKKISKEGEKEEWILLSAEEATKERIENAAITAYIIADAMIMARVI